jgi:2,3-bisphosphoglycerate-independent phosphoglycerate mutase
MKYAIIIPDGAADEPLAELGGKTPLEAAHTPNMDRIATEGRVGLVRTIPEGFESGSDVATMCLLGTTQDFPHRPGAARGGGAEHSAGGDRLGLPLQPRHRCRTGS